MLTAWKFRIYQEKASSAKADRPELMKLLDHARIPIIGLLAATVDSSSKDRLGGRRTRVL